MTEMFELIWKAIKGNILQVIFVALLLKREPSNEG